MKRKQKKTSGNTVVLLPGIYNETMQLLAEAHDYFSREGEAEQLMLSDRERTMYISEMSRITMRLSCIMAWFMAQKAVFSGKADKADAAELGRLGKLECRETCLNQNIEAEAILSDRVTDLLDESFELYQRVARLDDLKNTN